MPTPVSSVPLIVRRSSVVIMVVAEAVPNVRNRFPVAMISPVFSRKRPTRIS
jgi:hypothetical protein